MNELVLIAVQSTLPALILLLRSPSGPRSGRDGYADRGFR
jgi:hypothetical protein